MKKILCTIGILAILVSVACEDRDDNLMAPQVRIQNLSDFDFVRVRFDGKAEHGLRVHPDQIWAQEAILLAIRYDDHQNPPFL